MKTQILKISDPVKDTAKIKQAADCLAAGGLVVFATETVYGIACKADKKALKKLDSVKNRDSDKRYSLHLSNKDKISNYIPHLTLPIKKLIKNALPGPLTIVFQLSDSDIADLKKTMPAEQIGLLYKDNTIGIRCPDEPIAEALLNMCDFSVVAPSANLSGQTPATTATEAVKQLDGLVDIILDSGPCKIKQNSTVVKFSNTGLEILRAGAMDAEQILPMATVNILFVCTGNTCRSPMAEGLAQKELAGKLKCSVDQLGQMGYKIGSAGIMAVNGIGASPESIRFCSSKGVDISGHLSRRLTVEMLDSADYVFALSDNHLTGMLGLSPKAKEKCSLLDTKASICDPIGGGFELYRVCGCKIEKNIIKRISEFLK